MHPSYPQGDPPAPSVLRLMLVGAILRADLTLLALLADALQQTGLVHLAEMPTVPPCGDSGARPSCT
jgi:hypothetical protein